MWFRVEGLSFVAFFSQGLAGYKGVFWRDICKVFLRYFLRVPCEFFQKVCFEGGFARGLVSG